MPAWAWWVLISGGLCGLCWLYGRLSRPQGPASHGPWDTSWAVYFSPNGGAAHAILNGIRSAQHTILVQNILSWCKPISYIRRGWWGRWCAPTNGASRFT
jgi:hypothetical protein